MRTKNEQQKKLDNTMSPEMAIMVYHKSLDPIGFETNGTRDLSIYGGDY